MIKYRIFLLVVGVWICLNVRAEAVTFTYIGTQITGVNDITVLGENYNVKFKPGSHDSLMQTIGEGDLKLESSAQSWDVFRDTLRDTLPDPRLGNVWQENMWRIQDWDLFRLLMFDGGASETWGGVPAMYYISTGWGDNYVDNIQSWTDTNYYGHVIWAVWTLVDEPVPPATVPEPSAIMLLCIGLVGVMIYRRRHNYADMHQH